VSRAVIAFFTSIVLLTIGAVVYLAANITWNRSVVIEGGPNIGFFYATGEDLNAWLQENGVNSTLTYREDTLEIIADVNDPQNPVNVGFIAQEVDAEAYPNVVSLGSIVNEPLLFFARADLGEDLTLQDLAGRRVNIGPLQSGVNALASDVIDAYGLGGAIDLTYEPSAVGVEQVLAGSIDAVALLFPPQTPIIERLALDPKLRIVGLTYPETLATRIGYVQATTIPPSAFSLRREIPAEPITTIGIPVTVIANAELAPGNAYLIAERLEQVFSEATLTSVAGEFPNFVDAQLPPDPSARDFYAGGTPWQYRTLPHIIAEVLVPLLILGSIAIVLNSFYKLLLPDIHGLWAKVLSPRQRRAALDAMEKRRAEGKPLTKRQRMRLERVLLQFEADKVDRARAEALKTQIVAESDVQLSSAGSPP
jgi:uncharacterized protein